MKTIILSLLCACTFHLLAAQSKTVKLKITYYDAPVSDCDITIKHGDASIGSGRTDANGEVSMSAALISKSIDVYGKKETDNGKKTWDLKGYITLDDEYFSHLKMEVYVKEIAQGSGMPESMIVSAWGLALSGKNTAGNNSNNNASNSSNNASAASNDKDDDKADDDKLDIASLQGDALASQKVGYENEINVLDNKIRKSEKELTKLKTSNADQKEIEKEENSLETFQLRREKKQMNLDRVNAKIAGGDLSKEQIKTNNNRRDEIDVRLKELKDSAKETKKESKEEDPNKTALEKKVTELKIKLASLTVKQKVAKKAKKAAIQKEIDETKAEIEACNEQLKAFKG